MGSKALVLRRIRPSSNNKSQMDLSLSDLMYKSLLNVNTTHSRLRVGLSLVYLYHTIGVFTPGGFVKVLLDPNPNLFLDPWVSRSSS